MCVTSSLFEKTAYFTLDKKVGQQTHCLSASLGVENGEGGEATGLDSWIA
jgi:hypothetical protein